MSGFFITIYLPAGRQVLNYKWMVLEYNVALYFHDVSQGIALKMIELFSREFL
jgi:hypothetical protein